MSSGKTTCLVLPGRPSPTLGGFRRRRSFPARQPGRSRLQRRRSRTRGHTASPPPRKRGPITGVQVIQRRGRIQSRQLNQGRVAELERRPRIRGHSNLSSGSGSSGGCRWQPCGVGARTRCRAAIHLGQRRSHSSAAEASWPQQHPGPPLTQAQSYGHNRVRSQPSPERS